MGTGGDIPEWPSEYASAETPRQGLCDAGNEPGAPVSGGEGLEVLDTIVKNLVTSFLHNNSTEYQSDGSMNARRR